MGTLRTPTDLRVWALGPGDLRRSSADGGLVLEVSWAVVATVSLHRYRMHKGCRASTRLSGAGQGNGQQAFGNEPLVLALDCHF